MSPKKIGVAVSEPNSAAVLAGIERVEELGLPAAWLTTGPSGPDGLTLFASAAVRTRNTLLGTAITPTYPRHPVVVVQQVQVIAQLAPGRFRLGVGPSHRPTMVGTFGVDFRAPLGHLSEYLHILKALLREGSVDFQGDYYKAHASIAAPIDVPVMASALGPKAFELCGAESDGAISWVCPATYLRDVALPSMKAGADRAGRPVPPLIAHAPVCVHDNVDEVRAAIREQVPNPRLPFYQHMFAAAGYPEASNGTWSDAMIDGTALVGNESQVADKLEGLLALGATEVLASPIPAGADRAASLERTLQLLAQVSKA
jgi:F420-dependent oxidoreductase-like protein